VNTAAIIAGSLAGTLVRSKLPARFAEVIFHGIGLFTGCLGVSMWLQSDNYLPTLIGIVAGSLIGRWIGIGDRVDGLCARLTGRENMTHPTGTGFPFPPKEEAPGPQGAAWGSTEGLVTATIIFCVGSMSILGP
ncbi:MAG: DUF554 domain-containing protein, partial [Alistipes sp.]|nr:DUF554 domain-containing protein [Alistipes sp.]